MLIQCISVFVFGFLFFTTPFYLSFEFIIAVGACTGATGILGLIVALISKSRKDGMKNSAKWLSILVIVFGVLSVAIVTAAFVITILFWVDFGNQCLANPNSSTLCASFDPFSILFRLILSAVIYFAISVVFTLVSIFFCKASFQRDGYNPRNSGQYEPSVAYIQMHDQKKNEYY